MSETASLMKLKVAELRAQLESRGLDSKGTKPTLVSRLQEAIDKDGKGEISKTQMEDKGDKVESNSAGSILGTPRKSRRLSGNIGDERPETPTRKSRRLSGALTEDRPETPTRKGRLLSSTEDRPATPTRKSRRLSGGLEPVEERPLTPSRKSRRLSGAGEEEKNILLEDQLEGLGSSSSRRTSATARNKRISQLGGSSIATIPEVPEKENKIEVKTPELLNEVTDDVIAKDEVKKPTDNDSSPKNTTIATIPESTEEDNSKEDKIETVIKDKNNEVAGTGETSVTEVKNMETKDSGHNQSNGTNTSADKENLPISKVLDSIIVSKQIPRQKPKSGKFWKEGRQQFRQIKRDKGKKFTFEQRMKNKEEKIKNKELADLLLSRKAMKKEELRKKIEENKARKIENEKKSEQFQVIKNPAKIKRMKKKQLRMLEKRDVLTV